MPLTVTACGVTGQSGGKHVCVLATVLAAGLVAGKKRLGCHPDCRSLLDCHAKRRRSDNVAFHQCTPQFKSGDAGARGLQNITANMAEKIKATAWGNGVKEWWNNKPPPEEADEGEQIRMPELKRRRVCDQYVRMTSMLGLRLCDQYVRMCFAVVPALNFFQAS